MLYFDDDCMLTPFHYALFDAAAAFSLERGGEYAAAAAATSLSFARVRAPRRLR